MQYLFLGSRLVCVVLSESHKELLVSEKRVQEMIDF